MNIITAMIMGLIYNYGNLFGLYTTFFIVETAKFFNLM